MPVIVIAGATGTQGHSVALTFLSLRWTVRCLTRTPTSSTAQHLASLGAEIIQADLSSLSSLESAFASATAIFVNTDFWGPYRSLLAKGADQDEARSSAYATELEHAKNAALAASRVPELRVYVYSALGPMKRASDGKYTHSYHWETKAAAVDYITADLPDLAKKTSYIYIGAYATNKFLLPKKDKDGAYIMAMPGAKEMELPVIDVPANTGKYVRCLVEDEAPGTKLLAADETTTMGHALDAWMRVTGTNAEYKHLDIHTLHALSGLPYEVLDGAAFLAEYSYTAGVEGVITPRELKNPPVVDGYEAYLRKQDIKALLEVNYNLY